jgi:protein SCO1/2
MRSFLTPRWILPIVGLIVGIAAVILLWNAVRPHTFAGTLMQSPQPALDFTLTGPDGEMSLSSLRGKQVILFFGYSSCPDICPAALSVLRRAVNQLGKKAEQVQVVMVTVDPARDTPEILNRYVRQFNPAFIGLSGDLEKTTQIASQYGVFFEKRPGADAEHYTVDHTATLLLIDAKGYLRVVYPTQTDSDALASDIAYLLTH